MVLTAVVAGTRISEILGLQPRDIDSQAQTISIRRRCYRDDIAEPKSKKSKRALEVGRLANELLELAKAKPDDAFIFALEDGNPPDARDLQRAVFRPAAIAVGIYQKGFGMHTFRRLNISWR